MKHCKLSAFIAVCAAMLCAVLLFPACDDTLKLEKNPSITRAFLVGDALKGWTDYDGSPLTRPMSRTADTVFVFKGNLTSGYLKISCDEIPDWDGRWYLPPKDDTVLNTGREQPAAFSITGDGGEDGPKWEITQAALYTVTLNKAAGTIKCETVGAFEPEGTTDVFTHMWLILCEAAPRSVAMERNGDDWIIPSQRLFANTYVKFYGESLERTDWDSPYSLRWFCPLSDAAPAIPGVGDDSAEAGMFKYGADNSLAWKSPSTSAYYSITLRPREGTVTFVQAP